MLDVAIIGGGVCGLVLARELAEKDVSFALFEARERFGGRALSVWNRTSGQRLDLGPTWIWPDTEPNVCALVDSLGLKRFAQHDPGAVLYLEDPDKSPAERAQPGLHAGAQRIEGGMGALIQALAATAPPESLHLGWRLIAARDMGDHIELDFETSGKTETIAAKRVVIAVPPRLVAERMAFSPPLAEHLLAAMEDTPTWMAFAAKAVAGYSGPPDWRAQGRSGNAFVTHPQATLSEVFDACDASGEKAALGGFFALTPDLRESFRVGLQILVESQFVQLFGMAVADGETQIQDWSLEPFTCADADRYPLTERPIYGSTLLARPQWRGKLYFGGSETAREGGGHVEGAVNAAMRICEQITANRDHYGAISADLSAAPEKVNALCLERFAAWAADQRAPTFAIYRRRLVESLSRGQREQLTQRAMLGAVEETLGAALIVIEDLPFDAARVGVERGRSDLTPKVQAAFNGFFQELLDSVVEFNQTSCALSNFPDEHRPSKDYISTTLRDVAAAWREFSLDANGLLIEKRGREQEKATRAAN
jgi:monoamine oxidase